MDGGSRDPSAGRDKALAGREASMDGKEGWRLTGVGIRHGSCSLAVDGDREPGRRLRPGLGGEPEAMPEPAVREQVPQSLEPEPNQADPARAGAGPRRGGGTPGGRRGAPPPGAPPPRGP